MGRDRLNIDELFKFYYRPLCLYATHYVQDVEMAKDIVQDCFSSLWEKMNIVFITIEQPKLIRNIRV